MIAGGPGEASSGADTRFGLAASALRLRVAGRQLLDGAELEVRPGELLAVMGPSGAGKTSLLLVLAGVTRPDSGTVSLPACPEPASRRPVVGLVPQTLGLVSTLTVAENVAVPLQLRKVPPADGRARVAAALEAAGIESLGDRLVRELSGGQRQRVAVTRALAADPDVVIADEPTAELDAESQAVMVGLFAAQAARGASVVIATHDPAVTEQCSRVRLLRDGRLVDAP